MENTINLKLKKRLTMRGYQETIVNDIVSKFNIGKPYVLGSCPSSGKTEMAIESMVRLIELGYVNRVLILAHSTNVLKENFYNRLIEYFNEDDISIMRGQKNYNYNTKIQVMIPQNINHVIGNFDLIITDEAQHNVLAEDGNYDKIIEMVKPKFQLLLTGTPSKFVRENALSEGELPYYINTVGMDTIGFEHFHDVRFDLIKSSYGFTNDDYNQYSDLLTDIKFSFEETEKTINNVIIGAVRNIALRNGIILPKDSDFILEGKKLIKSGKFGKTLIMCRNIEQSNQIATIISKLFKVNVRVSQSKNDDDSRELENFKAGKFNFLCVVKRAREGYDDNKVMNLIDITMTHNIDLIYQMFCRVVRLDKTNPNPKLYIKVTSNAEGMPEYTMNIMTAALMLGSTENLARFNGSNFRDIEMPRIQQEDTDEEDDISINALVDITDNDGNVIRRRNINELMALDLIKMFSEDNENLVNGNDRYAMTTLGEALILLGGGNFYNDKEGYFKIMRAEAISNSDKWVNKYRELSERDKIRYNSKPWRFFGQNVKDFFKECYPNKIEIYNNKYGYFNIMRTEKITGGTAWLKIYKKLSVRDGVKYISVPWNLFNQSQKDFFKECYPEKRNFYDDKKGYFELFKLEEITSGEVWIKKYKELSERDNLKYHSGPWSLFGLSHKEFFDECYPEKREIFKDKNSYFKLMRNENIKSSIIWQKNYENLSERDNLKYHSNVWVLFNQSPKEFFDECYPNKQPFYSDKEGYITLIRDENITGSTGWINEYKRLSERDNLKYHSTPWKVFKQTEKSFFNECYSDRNILSNKTEYIKIIKIEFIKSGKDYVEKYKVLSKKYNLRLHSNPWRLFNQSESEFFAECHPNKLEIYSDKLGYFKLFRQSDIKSGKDYPEKYKNLSKKYNLRLHSNPWRLYNQKEKDFFKEFKEWLKNNPKQKKEYHPAYIGELSEMNKKWNTSNSNTNYKLLKKDNTEWKTYHKLYSKTREKWDEIPYIQISKKLKTRPEWIVGDFGCGENLLAKEIKNKVYAFDHIAIDDSVIACDLSCIPLDNEILDVAVFSLSLMYTNYEEYLKEAHRLLKPMGLLMIAEPRNRWSNDEGNLDNDRIKNLLDSIDFRITGDVKITERFIYIDAIKF